MLTRYFLLGGRALFTLEIPKSFADDHGLPDHYTFKVTRKEASERWPESFFVALLTGPNNEEDYTYMGMLDKATGSIRLTKASVYNEQSWPYRLLARVTSILFGDETEQRIERMRLTGFNLHHEGRCCRCGRTLTVPESIESGIGPECAKRMTI